MCRDPSQNKFLSFFLIKQRSDIIYFDRENIFLRTSSPDSDQDSTKENFMVFINKCFIFKKKKCENTK